MMEASAELSCASVCVMAAISLEQFAG